MLRRLIGLPCSDRIRLTSKDANSHTAIGGDTGSGKSSVLTRVMMDIERRGEMAVVYDPDREYARKFRDLKRGDWVLDPFVEECPWWDIAGEVKDEADAIALSSCLFPDIPGNKDPFWQDAARRFFAWLLYTYQPSLEELGKLMANDDLFDRMVKGTEFKTILTAKAPGLRSSVISHLNLAAQPMRMMPGREITDSAGNVLGERRRFTIREYAEKRNGWIFITSKPDHKVAMTPLHTIWMAGLILRVMSMGRRRDLPRVHFIFEEASDFTVDKFPDALKRLRKAECPVWFAIQNFIDFKEKYGDAYRTIFAQPKNKMLFRTAEGTSAAELEAAAGKGTWRRLEESESANQRSFLSRIFGIDRKTWRERLATEPLIEAHEFLNWNDRTGVLLQPGVAVPFEVPYVEELPDREPPLTPRDLPAGNRRKLSEVEEAEAPAEDGKIEVLH